MPPQAVRPSLLILKVYIYGCDCTGMVLHLRWISLHTKELAKGGKVVVLNLSVQIPIFKIILACI